MRVGGFAPFANQVADMFKVTNPNQMEIVNNALYDSAAYPALGSPQLTFFNQPVGQGTGFGGAAKTKSDTNMTLAGQLSQNTAFLVTSMEVVVQTATPTVAAGMPAVFGAELAATSVNDTYIIRRSGVLIFNILAKDYMTEGPLSRFAPTNRFRIDGGVADQSTIAASLQSRVFFADVDGGPRDLNPAPILLGPNTNFNVTLNWPEGLQAITNPARLFVHLNGLLYRVSQ